MRRLLPELGEDAPINREEVSLLFDIRDPDAGMQTFSEAAMQIPYSMKLDSETNEAEYRLGDIENIVLDWRGERRATNRRKARPIPDHPDDGGDIQAPEVRVGGKIIFADEDTPDSILLSDEGGKGGGTKAITVAHAAEQAGLSEDDLSARLIGRARLKVVNGDLVVPLSDLRELAKDGEIPEPVKSADKRTEATSDPLAVPTDPAVEKRTAQMGAALAMDAADTKPADPDSQPVPQQFTTHSASDRPRRRLGQPRRWSQR